MHSSPPDPICWRLHLASPPAEVYGALATTPGRESFWAISAPAVDHERSIEFRFPNGQHLLSTVIEAAAPRRFCLTYFGGSTVSFELMAAESGGTDLTLTKSGGPADECLENFAGWVAVLLALKTMLDFGVDLRNHDPSRTWDAGFVDG